MLVIAFSLVAGVAKVSASCISPCWHNLASPNPGTTVNILNSTFAASDNQVWAVGYYGNSSNNAQTLIQKYDGTSVTTITSTNAGTSSYLNGVASLRGTSIPPDAWAVGYYTTTSAANTLIEQYHNGSWSTITSTNPSTTTNVLNGVAGDNTADYWAVGYYYSSTAHVNQTLIEHYSGSPASWATVSSANHGSSKNNYLTSVTVVSTTLAWAAGYYNDGSNNQPLLLKWDGSSWSDHTSDLPSGLLNGSKLDSISFFDAWNGWGSGYNGTASTGLALQHKVTGWLNNSPTDGELQRVSTPSSSTAWVGGWKQSGKVDLAVSDYWDGTRWNNYNPTQVGLGGDHFRSLSALGNSDVWGVGFSYGNQQSTQSTYWEQYN